MRRLTAGNEMKNYVFDTAFKKGLTLKDAVNGKRTALLFLRYYGCTLCQYNLHLLKENYPHIEATGGQLLVVLQSDPDLMARSIRPGDLPFTIICDPKQEIYKDLGISAAASMEKMVDARTLEQVEKARALGLTHGEYEGEELQLPALFILKGDLSVEYAHYADTLSDIEDAHAIAALLAKPV